MLLSRMGRTFVCNLALRLSLFLSAQPIAHRHPWQSRMIKVIEMREIYIFMYIHRNERNEREREREREVGRSLLFFIDSRDRFGNTEKMPRALEKRPQKNLICDRLKA